MEDEIVDPTKTSNNQHVNMALHKWLTSQTDRNVLKPEPEYCDASCVINSTGMWLKYAATIWRHARAHYKSDWNAIELFWQGALGGVMSTMSENELHDHEALQYVMHYDRFIAELSKGYC